MKVLKAPEGMAEKAQVPAWIVTAVFDPTSHEHEPSLDEIPVGKRLGQSFLNLAGQFRGDTLIGIQNQYPLVLPVHVRQCPVFLLGKLAVPSEVNHSRPFTSHEFHGTVAGSGIHYHHI